MKKFLVTTALGGVLFLVPMVFVVLILGKAFGIMKMVAAPLGRFFPLEHIAGIGLVNILALVIMLLVCLLAGLIASSRPALALYSRLDSLLMGLIPGYAWTKNVIASISGDQNVEGFKPVLVTLDDMAQAGFEVERSSCGKVVVFLPGAPDARSGSVAYVNPERVTPLDATFFSINKSLRYMGKGSAKFLPPRQD
jgi:uncharacterized membrane protein